MVTKEEYVEKFQSQYDVVTEKKKERIIAEKFLEKMFVFKKTEIRQLYDYNGLITYICVYGAGFFGQEIRVDRQKFYEFRLIDTGFYDKERIETLEVHETFSKVTLEDRVNFEIMFPSTDWELVEWEYNEYDEDDGFTHHHDIVAVPKFGDKSDGLLLSGLIFYDCD